MKAKTEYLHIRVTVQEKQRILATAKAEGLGDMSAYLLWLHRTFLRNQKNNLQKPAPPLDKSKSEM